MTYVSRKTRIIISRWSDECDAEYTLRLFRKRSDARLKRHASCDDSRAWINDYCIRHEHLVDLMSDGEFSGKPPFRLYGRFIPVPILFKLTQSTRLTEDGEDAEGRTGRSVRGSRSDTRRNYYGSKEVQVNRSASESRSQDSKLESISRLEWEKNLLEQRLCECTCLLNKAVGQLEKIGCIVGDPDEGRGNVRNEEIQKAFYKSKIQCTCPSPGSNTSPESLSPSRSYVRKLRESARCTELMRKISGLREKLKKIQECRQEVSQQIRLSQMRTENCSSSCQVTELYSRREQAHAKRLQKKLEKLIAERGKLLSEMCQTLTCLNSIKRSSRSLVSCQRNKGRKCGNFGGEKPGGSTQCPCGCACSEYIDTTDSERVQCSGSSSAESGMNQCYSKRKSVDVDTNNELETDDMQTTYGGEFPDCGSFYSEDQSLDENFMSRYTNNRTSTPSPDLSSNRTFTIGPSNPQRTNKTKQKSGFYSEDQIIEAGSGKSGKKSKIVFECPEPTCSRPLYSDDLSAYKNSLNATEQTLILGAIKNIQNRRPTTSPTTKRERDAVAPEYRRGGGYSAQQCSTTQYIPERHTKSETTMKEIEKTLRNYEQRLNQLDTLECRIERLKQKSSDADRLKENLEKLRCEVQREKVLEKEKSAREITKLCSENWELKMQVQQLTAKFEAQCKKMVNLKCSAAKARELECEAEELKKELSEYRDSYEHQRKCISKWESVVAVQRTEIESLMNHIRKLTTMREEAMGKAQQAKKNVQRSRSYSPDVKTTKAGMTKGASARGKTAGRNFRESSEEEERLCYCNEYLEEENRQKSQQRGSSRVYCSTPGGRGNWCD